MKETLVIIAVIYLSLILGILLKMRIYSVPVNKMLFSVLMPPLILVALPVSILSDSKNKDRTVKETIINIFVIFYIALKYFPVIVGMTSKILASKKIMSKNNIFSSTKKDQQQDGNSSGPSWSTAGRRLYDDLGIV